MSRAYRAEADRAVQAVAEKLPNFEHVTDPVDDDLFGCYLEWRNEIEDLVWEIMNEGPEFDDISEAAILLWGECQTRMKMGNPERWEALPLNVREYRPENRGRMVGAHAHVKSKRWGYNKGSTGDNEK